MPALHVYVWCCSWFMYLHFRTLQSTQKLMDQWPEGYRWAAFDWLQVQAHAWRRLFLAKFRSLYNKLNLGPVSSVQLVLTHVPVLVACSCAMNWRWYVGQFLWSYMYMYVHLYFVRGLHYKHPMKIGTLLGYKHCMLPTYTLLYMYQWTLGQWVYWWGMI